MPKMKKKELPWAAPVQMPQGWWTTSGMTSPSFTGVTMGGIPFTSNTTSTANYYTASAVTSK